MEEEKKSWQLTLIPFRPPAPSNSHHQNSYTFSPTSPPLKGGAFFQPAVSTSSSLPARIGGAATLWSGHFCRRVVA